MQKPSLSNKVFTENPLLDEIIYNARQLATGVVLKDSDRADAAETVESIQAGDIYVAVINGNISFSYFTYDYDLLLDYYINEDKAARYVADNSLIPEADRPGLAKRAAEQFVAGYQEYNAYYRMLHGLPALETPENWDYQDDWEGLWIDTTKIDEFNPTSLEYISQFYLGENYELIHELGISYQNLLYENGTFLNILEATDQLTIWSLTRNDVEYLMHTGDRSIDYYDARSADKFGLLYCPPCDSEEVRRRFKDLCEANRLYCLYTMYSEAYKYRSDYYDNFMMIFIILQTIIDMIVELPDYIIRRDVFDARTCKYIFESNGVKYFRDIPLKYQIALVKNLNKLIKFKSTDRCIVDIVSIFGIDNIQVFKYYILKDRLAKKIKDETGNEFYYYDYTKEVIDEEGNHHIVPDDDENYDIKFIKVPILEKYDDYIRTESNLRKYETMTDGDPYWIGDKTYDSVESDIKNLDFTVLRSKYYSIEAVIDLARRNFTLIYFMNILLYNKIDKTDLKVNLPNISTTKKFELVDAILALYSLSYIYYGVEDTILDSKAKIAQILGFNMEADFAKISNYLYENHRGLDMHHLHVDTFETTDDGRIYSFNELQDIYLTNKDCYKHILHMLMNPPSKEIYNAYRYLYKTLLIMNRNMEAFIIEDNALLTHYRDELGYGTKFITIPEPTHYHNPDDYERDMKWLVDSLEENMLYFEMDVNKVDATQTAFDIHHKFNLWIKNSEGELEQVNTVEFDSEGFEISNNGPAMASTYREYLRYKDSAIYIFLQKIANITNFDNRQEACVNAIQAIISYLQDYIDQDVVDLNELMAGLPSISLDFIRQYVAEVIDYFKSFKIFTHGSSIVYMISDKFENTVQLIDWILLKYLFDKHDIVKIEDYIKNMQVDMSHEERIKLIDKLWFDIHTWVQKNYAEFYCSERYADYARRIEHYLDQFNQYHINDVIRDEQTRFTTLEMNDRVFTEKYISEIESYAVDAIIRMLVDLSYEDEVALKESTHMQQTRKLNEYYNEWMADIIALFNSVRTVSDRIPYQDDETHSIVMQQNTFDHIYESINLMSLNSILRDKATITDNYYKIITQEFPAHVFDE